MRISFDENLGVLSKKHLLNFSNDHSAKVLEHGDQAVILDAVMQIYDDSIALNNAFEISFSAMEAKLKSAFES